MFGPSAAAARIEGSKAFAKDVMAAAGVPTARLLDVPVAPCVVKADGLAAGKGVVICRDEAELAAGLEEVAAFGGAVVVEELLEGPEVSLFAICDGDGRGRASAGAGLQARLRRRPRARTPGGMGSFAPVPGLGREMPRSCSSSSCVRCSPSSRDGAARSSARSSRA